MERVEQQTVRHAGTFQVKIIQEMLQSEEGFFFYIFFLNLSFSYYTMCLNSFSGP